MSPVVAIGVALALNTAMLLGGLVWLKRQQKLVAAERRSARGDMRSIESAPSLGEEVLILVEDGSGMVAERAAIRAADGRWTDARTHESIDDDVLGWRPRLARDARATGERRL